MLTILPKDESFTELGFNEYIKFVASVDSYATMDSFNPPDYPSAIVPVDTLKAIALKASLVVSAVALALN